MTEELHDYDVAYFNYWANENDLIAWAYMDDDFVPTPNLKIKLEED